MSFWLPRPIVSCAESSSNCSPSPRAALLTTMNLPVRGPGREACRPPLDGLAVDLVPVGRAEVDDPVGRALLPQLGMPPRDVGIAQLDVAVAGATDHEPPLFHLVTRPVVREREELLLDAELLGRNGLRRYGWL